MNEKLMIKGFNDGYLLQKHHPELAKHLQQGFTNKAEDYATGFAKGIKEHGKELALEKDNYKKHYFEKIKTESLSVPKEKDHSLDLDENQSSNQDIEKDGDDLSL